MEQLGAETATLGKSRVFNGGGWNQRLGADDHQPDSERVPLARSGRRLKGLHM